MNTPVGTAPRLYYLDWLRIGAFALLLLYHVGMYYVSWKWHVKSPAASMALEPLMHLSNPWRMSLLFLLSGAATVWMLRSHPGSLLRDRAKRLLLPLITGMVLVVPPQSYFEVVQKFNYAGSYLDFLQLYFSRYRGFCESSKCLILPTWNHLWFLPYLFVYTAALLALRRWLPAPWTQALGNHFGGLSVWMLWLLPIVPLALARLYLLPRFGMTHALVDDGYQHTSFFIVFLLGAGLAARPALLQRLESLRWPALAAALACWWGRVDVFEQASGPGRLAEMSIALLHISYAVQQWSMVVALLGFARRHWNHDHPWRAPLNEAVFPIYLLHQTLIILLAMALLPLAWSPAVEGPLLVLGTLVLSLVGWWWLRRSGPLRLWFGLPPVRK